MSCTNRSLSLSGAASSRRGCRTLYSTIYHHRRSPTLPGGVGARALGTALFERSIVPLLLLPLGLLPIQVLLLRPALTHLATRGMEAIIQIVVGHFFPVLKSAACRSWGLTGTGIGQDQGRPGRNARAFGGTSWPVSICALHCKSASRRSTSLHSDGDICGRPPGLRGPETWQRSCHSRHPQVHASQTCAGDGRR